MWVILGLECVQLSSFSILHAKALSSRTQFYVTIFISMIVNGENSVDTYESNESLIIVTYDV